MSYRSSSPRPDELSPSRPRRFLRAGFFRAVATLGRHCTPISHQDTASAGHGNRYFQQAMLLPGECHNVDATGRRQ